MLLGCDAFLVLSGDVDVPLDGGDDSVGVVLIEETSWGCLGSGLGLHDVGFGLSLGLLNSGLLLLELLAIMLELLLFSLELLLLLLELLPLGGLVVGFCLQLGLVFPLGLSLAIELALVWHCLVVARKSCNWRGRVVVW